MGLQWRQADVSIRIRHCVFLNWRSAQCECMLLYLAKKVGSIFGHKDCEEGSMVWQPCEDGGGW